MGIKTTPNVPPFVKWCSHTIPAVFDDSLTYYEALCSLWKWLQSNLVEVVNNNASVTQEYIEMTDELKQFVDNYFDNLDVQEEINNKLDAMAQDGTLASYFQRFVQPSLTAMNRRIDVIENKVDKATSIAPQVVNSISEMVDTSKTYVLLTDGNWYYYNGSEWTVGGAYNSDVTVDEIEYALSMMSVHGTTAINPYTCKDNTGLTSQTGAETPSSTSWCTDFIEVSSYVTLNNIYYFGSVATIDTGQPINVYKRVFYNEDKEFLKVDTATNSAISFGGATSPEDAKYVRLQFNKSTISFEDRNKLIVDVKNDGAVSTGEFSSFYSIDNVNVKPGAITSKRLANNLRNSIKQSMVEHGINPFDKDDIVYGTIDSTSLKIRYHIALNRLATCDYVTIPAGVTIKLTNGWQALAFSYTDEDEPIDRFISNWSTSLYIPSQTNLRLAFRIDDTTQVTNPQMVEDLLNNISIEKISPNFTYVGEKISLFNTYDAKDTGIVVAGQDSASYGDIVMSFTSDGRYKVMNINGEILQDTVALDQRETIKPHANSACFSSVKYDAGDNYPLVYVNAYNTVGLPKGTCYVYRLKNDYLTSLVQTIRIGFTEEDIWTGGGSNVRPYGNFVVDTDNNKLYVYTMIDNLHVTRFFKFNLPSLDQGSTIVLNESDIEETFDVDYMYYIQGCAYFNGKIYASCGFTSNDCKLYAVDLFRKSIVTTLPLGGIIGEPETVIVSNGELYVSSTRLFKLKF